MRSRVIRPEFWSDTTMAKLPPAVRLTYIGLWCITDDAGFLEWEPEQIAGELYRHEEPAARLARLEIELATLIELGRIRLLGCGRHAVVPTIPEYRIRGGVHLYTVKKRHDHRCSSVALRSSTDHYVSDSVSDSDSVSESARARELSPEAVEAWAALGSRYGRPNGH